MVRELLDFSKPSRGEPTPVDVNLLVTETLSLRIVESFGGAISFESAEAKGARFTVRLKSWKKQNADQ
jgi:hypothetical protein